MEWTGSKYSRGEIFSRNCVDVIELDGATSEERLVYEGSYASRHGGNFSREWGEHNKSEEEQPVGSDA